MRLGFVVLTLGFALSPVEASAEEMTLPNFEGVGRGVTLLWEGPKDRKTAALTFDDGPARGKTEAILDILLAEGVPATFFVLGENAQRHPEILARMVREGHEIGNHTFSHPNLTKLPHTKVREEIKRTQDVVFEAAGVRPRFFRPPYGAANLTTMSILSSQNLAAVFWSIDPQDWKGGGVSEIVASVTQGLENGAIILLHEKSPNTEKSVPGIIRAVRERGFEFVTLSDMFGPFPESKGASQPLTLESAPPPDPIQAAEEEAANLAEAVQVRRLEPAVPRPVELAKADPAEPPAQSGQPMLDAEEPPIPVPTNTPTVTATATPSPTTTSPPPPSPTPSATKSPLPQPTATHTPTATFSPSSTATATSTPSPTLTSTFTPTLTPTSTPTLTATPTPTATSTATPLPAPTLESPRGYGEFVPAEFRRLRPIRNFTHRFITEGG